MAVTKIHKTSKMVLYITAAITIVITLLFLFGGQLPEAQRITTVDASVSQPAFTGVLLYWMYALLAATILVLLGFSILGLFSGLKKNRKATLQSIFGLVALVVLLIITYLMGNGTPLNIVGYNGSDNVPGTLKMTDMWIYSMYVMLGLTIFAILLYPVLQKMGKKN